MDPFSLSFLVAIGQVVNGFSAPVQRQRQIGLQARSIDLTQSVLTRSAGGVAVGAVGAVASVVSAALTLRLSGQVAKLQDGSAELATEIRTVRNGIDLLSSDLAVHRRVELTSRYHGLVEDVEIFNASEQPEMSAPHLRLSANALLSWARAEADALPRGDRSRIEYAAAATAAARSLMAALIETGEPSAAHAVAVRQGEWLRGQASEWLASRTVGEQELAPHELMAYLALTAALDLPFDGQLASTLSSAPPDAAIEELGRIENRPMRSGFAGHPEMRYRRDEDLTLNSIDRVWLALQVPHPSPRFLYLPKASDAFAVAGLPTPKVLTAGGIAEAIQIARGRRSGAGEDSAIRATAQLLGIDWTAAAVSRPPGGPHVSIEAHKIRLEELARSERLSIREQDPDTAEIRLQWLREVLVEFSSAVKGADLSQQLFRLDVDIAIAQSKGADPDWELLADTFAALADQARQVGFDEGFRRITDGRAIAVSHVIASAQESLEWPRSLERFRDRPWFEESVAVQHLSAWVNSSPIESRAARASEAVEWLDRSPRTVALEDPTTLLGIARLTLRYDPMRSLDVSLLGLRKLFIQGVAASSGGRTQEHDAIADFLDAAEDAAANLRRVDAGLE